MWFSGVFTFVSDTSLHEPSTFAFPHTLERNRGRCSGCVPRWGANLAPSPGFPSGRDPDGVKRVLHCNCDPIPILRPKGEGQAVSVHSTGVVAVESVLSAQSQGGETPEILSILPQSTSTQKLRALLPALLVFFPPPPEPCCSTVFSHLDSLVRECLLCLR